MRPPNLKSWIRPCIKIDYAVSKYNHIFTCLRQTITWFISLVNFWYQDVTFNKHTSKGHSIFLNNTFQTYKLCLYLREIYSFLFISIFYILIVNLIKLPTFIPKYKIIFILRKGVSRDTCTNIVILFEFTVDFFFINYSERLLTSDITA